MKKYPNPYKEDGLLGLLRDLGVVFGPLIAAGLGVHVLFEYLFR